MKSSRILLVLTAISTMVVNRGYTQATLSANSGINSVDTWVAATLSMSENGTVTLASPQYNPQTQKVSATWPVPSTLSYNIEAGYDLTGGLVVIYTPLIQIWAHPSKQWSAGECNSVCRRSVVDIRSSGQPISDGHAGPKYSSADTPSLPGLKSCALIIGGIVVPRDPVHLPRLAASLKASLGSLSGSTTAMSIPSVQGTSQTAQIAYAVGGSYWVAQSITLTTPLANGTSVRSFALSNVSWNDNAVNDNIRAGIASTIVAPPTASSPPSYTWPAVSTAPTLTSGTIVPTNCNAQTYQLGGPQNVAFEHGFTSDACAWPRMVNWLNQDFRFGTELLASTGGQANLTTQGNTLISQIESAGGNGYVLIGHSEGSVVSRFAAQYFQNSSQLNITPYVATMDGVHQGANITASAPLVAVGIGTAMVLSCTYLNATGSRLTGYLFIAGGNAAAAGLALAGGGLADMEPGSAFLQNLNSVNENFGRAGIIGHTNHRWSIVRYLTQYLIGSIWKTGINGPYPQTAEPCNPEDFCGERVAAQTAEVVYDSLVVAAVVDAFIGIFYPPARSTFFSRQSIGWMWPISSGILRLIILETEHLTRWYPGPASNTREPVRSTMSSSMPILILEH